jgi:hypothetical protein
LCICSTSCWSTACCTGWHIPAWRRAQQQRDLRLQLVVPEPLRRLVLLAYHEDSIAGHAGITSTYDNIRRRYWWPSMMGDVVSWVNSCRTAQLGGGRVSVLQRLLIRSGPAASTEQKLFSCDKPKPTVSCRLYVTNGGDPGHVNRCRKRGPEGLALRNQALPHN